jgi:hypothetical protein
VALAEDGGSTGSVRGWFLVPVLPDWLPAALAGVAATGAAVVAVYIAVDGQDQPNPAPLPLPAKLDIDAGYQGYFECVTTCERWSGTEILVVTIPLSRPESSVEKMESLLAGDGWRRSSRGEVGRPAAASQTTEVRRFERPFARRAPNPDWRPRVTFKLPLPEVFLSPLELQRFPPGTVPWPVDSPARAASTGVTVQMVLSRANAVLEHPRYAVAATSPSSTAVEAADATQERRVDLGDNVNLADTRLEVDLVPQWLRTPVGVKAAAFSVPLAIAGMLTALVAAVVKRSRAKALALLQRAWHLPTLLWAHYADFRTQVAVTGSGGRYHRSSCPCFGPQTVLQSVRRSQAKSHGQAPCQLCRPGA